MTGIINMLFVYGTLLKGEERNGCLGDCKLIRSLEVPGRLYDTKMGYPVSVFDTRFAERVTGEIYLMENPINTLSELDRLEEVETGLYERVLLNKSGMDFYSYQAGESLAGKTTEENRIENGSWRRCSSLSLSDPARFAINFEDFQKRIYKAPASHRSDGLIYIKGDIPVIVTAPHATAHVRMGKLKRQEFYTGALAALLHNLRGCHVLYSNSLSETDPNYYDDSTFKEKLTDIARRFNIRFLVDLHGTGPGRDSDIFPGMGMGKEFLLGNDIYFDALQAAAESYSISIGPEDVFPAVKQMTVTKYAARKLGVPAMQLEIVRELRKPESSPEGFVRLTGFLKDFISQLSFS